MSYCFGALLLAFLPIEHFYGYKTKVRKKFTASACENLHVWDVLQTQEKVMPNTISYAQLSKCGSINRIDFASINKNYITFTCIKF